MYELPAKSRIRDCLAFRWQARGWMYHGVLTGDSELPTRRGLDHVKYRLRMSRWPLCAAFICGFAAAAVAWSYFSYRESYAVAPGKVQLAAPQTIPIRPSQTGKLLKIDVADGTRVKQGDALAEFDTAETGTARSALQGKLNEFRAEIERHAATIAAARAEPPNRNVRIVWAESTPRETQIREDRLLRAELGQLSDTLDGLAEQKRLAVLRRERAQASITAQKALLDVLTEQFKMRDGLSKQNYDSRIHVLDILKEIKRVEIDLTALESGLGDASAAVAAIDNQVARTRETFLARKKLEIGEAESAAADLEGQLKLASAKTDRTTLSAPVSGTVKALLAASVGKVMTPDEALMNIEQDGGQPEIVAYIPKTEIGFVEPNQEAVIKIDPLSSEHYGAISGKVTQVAARGEPGVEPQPQFLFRGVGSVAGGGTLKSGPMFPVLVAPSANSIKLKEKDVPLSPGMIVSVKIKTDKRRMIDYLLAPIMVASSAAGDL